MDIPAMLAYFDHSEGYATDYTAKCGGYRLDRVLPTSLTYWFDLKTTSDSSVLRNVKNLSNFGPFW